MTATTAHRARTTIRTAWRLLGVLVSTLLLVALVTQDVSLVPLALVCGVAGVASLVSAGKMGVLSWSFGVPLFYFVFFGLLPAIQQIFGSGLRAEPEDLGRALILASAGVALFALLVAATPPAWSTPGRNAPPFVDSPTLRLTEPSFVFVCILIGTGAITYSFFFGYYGFSSELQERGEFAGAASAVAGLADIGLVAAWLHVFTRPTLRWRSVAMFSLIGVLGAALFAKSKGALILPVASMGTAYFVAKGRAPLVALLCALALYLAVAFPFVTTWREQSSTTYASRTDQVVEGLRVLREGQWIDAALSTDAHTSLGRGVLETFSQVVERTGTATNFEDGLTYALAVSGFVPRPLWPDKPDFRVGNYIGHKYGILGQGDDITSIAITMMGEGYMNFGAAGIAGVMLLMGMFSILLDCFVVPRVGRWFAAWSFSYAFLGQEGIAGGAFAGYVKTCTTAFLVLALTSIAMSTFRIRRTPGSLGHLRSTT